MHCVQTGSQEAACLYVQRHCFFSRAGRQGLAEVKGRGGGGGHSNYTPNKTLLVYRYLEEHCVCVCVCVCGGGGLYVCVCVCVLNSPLTGLKWFVILWL